MINDKIKKIRTDKGISVNELAESSHISASYLYQIEKGDKNPSLDTLKDIAKALNIAVSDLLKVEIPPMSMEAMKTMFPTVEAEIKFISDPNIQKAFNYSFDELVARGGYHDLLIIAIEKAIKNTVEDIKTHLKNGDIFDGVSSWISKDSPLYEIVNNSNQKK